MLSHLMYKKGHSAVVRYQDERGNLWAKIIPSHVIDNLQGTSFDLPQSVLDEGVDYGFSFDVIMTERVIRPEQVQNAMRAHGVWTFEDMLKKPKSAQAAIQSLIRLIQGELTKGALDAIGR